MWFRFGQCTSDMVYDYRQIPSMNGLSRVDNFNKSTLELSLNEEIDGQHLSFSGRAFQIFGAMCFMDLVSE